MGDDFPQLHPFDGMNVWALVETRARVTPERPAMVWAPFVGEGRTWTFAELRHDAAAIAAGMQRRGVSTGDHVLVHLENCPEFVLTWYACAAIGAVAVTTNTNSAEPELRYYAEHSGAVAAVTQPRFAALVAAAAPALRWVAVTDHDAGEPAPVEPAVSMAALRADPAALVPGPVDPWAPMSVQYTSGTTARPKGVLWTQANALWGARTNALHEDLRAEDRHLLYLPLFHANGLSYSMLASLWAGAGFVLVPKWSTSRFWDISLRHGCTWVSLMGLSGRALLTLPVPAGHRYRMAGAAVCDGPWDELLGTKTVGWWGMTETISHPVVGDAHVPNRPLSMGRPSPEYGIRVVDDRGDPVDVEQAGNLLVRGVPGLSLFAGYLHDPGATAAAFEDGWFHTGDLVMPHADGHLSFVNRSKDMLKVGAENVAASEVERVLLTVPGVVEAAVVGRPDDKLDEVPVAFVVAPAADGSLPDRAVTACRAELAGFKVPRAVYVVRELPRSTLSKVDKVALRAVARPGDDRESAQERWEEAARRDPSGDAS